MTSDISNPFNSRDVAVLGDVQFVGATASRATFTLRDAKEAASERLTLRVDAHLDDVFRLRIDSGDPSSLRPDYGLLAQADPLATLTVSESERGWRINMGRATLVIERALLRISLTFDGRVVLSSITDQHFRGRARIPAFGRGNPETAKAGHWCVALALQSATAVYGFGEKFGRLDKRGQLVRGRIEDALGVNTELSYKNIPFCWSPDGWGLMVHTPGVVYHGVGYPQWSHRSYVADVEDAALDLFVFAGAPAEILNQYTTLTGRAALPPLWSYGMWLSRAYYKTPQEAIDTAAELRERGVPCDVITLDGRAAWEVRTRFAFEWDKSRFDDPKKILATLRSFNLKVCAWEYPYVSIHNPLFNELAKKGWLLKRADGEAYVFDWVKDPTDDPFGSVLTPLPPSGVLDFTHPDAAKFWADSHNKLFDDGVDVIKTDFGEQVEDDMHAHNGDSGRRLHNVYPLLYNKCVFEATQRYNDQHERGSAMVWGRDGFIGSQRYPMQWGGDPQTDWEGMAASIRAGLGYGMSGVPYYASDVGGFYGAQQPDTELYLRWTANGLFCSHFRYHGIGLREPWALGEETERIAKELLAFRYQLIPYIAGCAEQAARTGLPMMRAMPLAFPQERAAHAFELQYLFGDALLFAPIIAAGGETEVYFPRGAGNETWIDCLTGERIAGGEVRRVRRALNELALFGREGHVLCLGRAVQHTGEIDLQAPIEEVWLFGQPKHAPCVMGSSLSLDATGNLRGIGAARCRRIDRQ
jgi:alpha-D-xyloside xylohydrolase